MKSLKSRRVEWAIGGLFLLPFTLAKPPVHSQSSTFDEWASHARNGGIAEQRPRDYLSTKRYMTRNASTAMSETWSEPDESSFIKRSSRSSEPRLPDYPRDSRRDSFPNAQPHVTEPESDYDTFWDRHPAGNPLDEDGRELPHENHEEKLSHSPVVYQYFGRSRSRVHTADSIPFILLGPTVDHWKTVGQTLASRGFSVMACEILNDGSDQPEQGKNLILAVLDALRWNRAILVGCDSEAILAIEAAIQLAPERVKGLVLCGDLTDADLFAKRAAGVDNERLKKFIKKEDEKRHIVLDSLLNNYLECPYTLVWDGDVAQAPKASGDSSAANMNSGDMFRFNRCLILGGGTAPHRRRPEQFAWALTRFVEEKVAPRTIPLQIHAPESGNAQAGQGVWRLSFLAGFENIFSHGSLLVSGRVVASIIFYATALRIAVYQYDSLRGGVVSINTLVQCMNSSKQRVCQNVGAFIRNYGYIFSLFSRSQSNNEDEVKNYEEDNVELPSDEGNEEELDSSCDNATEKVENEDGEEKLKDEIKDQDSAKDEAKTPDGKTKREEPPGRLMLLDLVVV